MKPSNIILLSFLIFLFGGITLLCFGSRYYNEKHDKSNFAIQEKKTAAFSVVVAEPGAYLVLKNGKDFKVSQSYMKDAVPDFASFVVRNDTLFMSAVKSKIEGKWFIVPEVYCKNVKIIIAKEKANVNLKNYEVDSLFVSLNKSDFFWDFKKTAVLSIAAKNSYLHLEGDNLEKINLQLDKTELQINSKQNIKELAGSLINDSYINCPIDGKMSLSVDKSSKIYLGN